MTRYQVTVEAIIRKTYEIEAVGEYDAQNQANEMFTVEPEGGEYYGQQAIDVEEMEVSDESRSYGPRR